jgi:hypothetical protein
MRGRRFWTALSTLMLASTLGVHHLSAQATPPKPDSSKTAKKAAKTAAKSATTTAATTTPPATLTPKQQKKIDRKAAKTEKKADKPVVDAKNATAKCKDGTYTATTSRSGACSGHGGVAEWMKKS